MDPHPRCLGPGGGVPTQGLGGGPTSGPSSGLGLSLPGKREFVLTPQPPEVSRPSQDTGWQSLSCPVPRVVRAPAQLPPQPSPLLSCCRPDSRHPRRASPMGAADPGCQPAWLGRGTDGRRVLFLSFQDLGRRSLELTGSLVGADCACPCCLSGPAQPPRTPQPTCHLFCIWLVPTGSPSPRQALGLVGREEARVWTCAVAVLLSAWGFRTGSLPSQHQPCSVRGRSWPPTPSPPRQRPRASWQTPDG